jgi:sulfatase maturation enzyme AslB (radical SAM superfamily)
MVPESDSLWGEPCTTIPTRKIFSLLQKSIVQVVSIFTNLYYSEAQQDKVIGLSARYGIGIHTSYDGLGDTADRLRGAKDVQATVERAMNRINELRKQGIYQRKPTATVVISALNIDQIPDIIQRLQDLDWNLNADLYRWGSINHREQDILKLNDKAKVIQTINLIRRTKNLKTPLWYYDGLLKYLVW